MIAPLSSLIPTSAAPLPDALREHGAPAGHRRARVLYIASTRHSGGLEMASIRLAALLMRADPERQEIVYACRPGCYVEAACREAGIPTVPLTIVNSGDLRGVRRLTEIMADERIDIAHAHSRRDYVPAALAKLRWPRGERPAPKLLLHMHLMRPLGTPSPLSGAFFGPVVDRFLVVSNAVRRYLLGRHRQVRPEQVSVIPNSVDADRYRGDALAGAAIRARHGIAPSAAVIGMVGRLDTKGQDDAIRALALLPRGQAHLLLVGAAGSSRHVESAARALKRFGLGELLPYDGYLRRLARRLGVEQQVHFAGAQRDIAPYLSAMTLLLHLPRHEAFGLAVAEAMAAGVPVIASRVGGCEELIDDGVTGLLAPRRRAAAAAVAERVQRLIGDPALRERLAGSGQAMVCRRYTPEAQAAAVAAVYADLLQGDSVAAAEAGIC